MKSPNHTHPFQTKLRNGVRADLARARQRRRAAIERLARTERSSARRPRALTRWTREIAALARLDGEIRNLDLTG